MKNTREIIVENSLTPYESAVLKGLKTRGSEALKSKIIREAVAGVMNSTIEVDGQPLSVAEALVIKVTGEALRESLDLETQRPRRDPRRPREHEGRTHKLPGRRRLGQSPHRGGRLMERSDRIALESSRKAKVPYAGALAPTCSLADRILAGHEKAFTVNFLGNRYPLWKLVEHLSHIQNNHDEDCLFKYNYQQCLLYLTKCRMKESSRQVRINILKALSFSQVDFDKDNVPRKYTYFRPVSVPFACFGFRSEKAANSVLTTAQIVYSVPMMGRGNK